MLNKADVLLLQKSQKIADRFSELTGKTKFCLEKWFFIASSLFLGSFSILKSISVGTGFPYLLTSLLLFWTALGTWSMERREKIFLSSGKLMFTPESQPNFRKVFLVFDTSTITISIILLIEIREFLLIYLVSSMLLSLFALYFSACTPRPPCKGKIQKWYEGLLWRINDALAPTGASS